jgi:hypothetical protein
VQKIAYWAALILHVHVARIPEPDFVSYLSFFYGWEDNIRMNLRKIGWEGVNLMHLAQDRDQWRAVVNTIMNLWVP